MLPHRRPDVYAGGGVKETITIPRLEEEGSRAYAARVEYVTAGPQRSLEKLVERAQSAPKARPTQRLATLKRWSSKYDWVDHARRYDDTLAGIAAQEAADAYRADLEAHRKKAMEAGQGLYTVAGRLLKKLDAALSSPRQIVGEDGKLYTLHGIDFTAATLTTVSRALQTALDLEAHALGVDKLLPSLEADDSE